MPSFLEPDPILLFFSAFKEWIYLTVLVVYGLFRNLFLLWREARPLARRASVLGLVVTGLFVCAVFLVPYLGISSGPLFLLGGLVGGVGVPLFCSAFYGVAAVQPGRRFWVLDGLHLLWILALIGLWAYAVFG